MEDLGEELAENFHKFNEIHFQTGRGHELSQFKFHNSSNLIETELLNSSAYIVNEKPSNRQMQMHKLDGNLHYADTIDLSDLENDFEINELFIGTSTPTEEIQFENRCDNTNLSIGSFVCINNKKKGHLRYVGKVHFASGLFCGIELEDADGKHDGKIENTRLVYFYKYWAAKLVSN